MTSNSFNLSKFAHFDDISLLKAELSTFHICPAINGYDISIGDENLHCPTLADCLKHIEDGIGELKEEIWQCWQDLHNVAQVMLESTSGNEGGLDNVIFLNAVNKSYFLSKAFSELLPVSNILQMLFDANITEIHNNLIIKFNTLYLKIVALNRLILNEIYRTKIIKQWQQLTKQAQVSGPWANVDLPMAERVYPWFEAADELQGREDARKKQERYNPEYVNGFYYVDKDLNRSPYRFEDRQTESPYKSNNYLSIA